MGPSIVDLNRFTLLHWKREERMGQLQLTSCQWSEYREENKVSKATFPFGLT
jgi:hypothetical protein